MGGLIDCTPVSPTDSISETVLLKKEEVPQQSIPGVDIIVRFATAFSGALTEAFKGKDTEVIAYAKEVKEIANKFPVDSLPVRPDSLPVGPDSLPIQPDSSPVEPDSLPIRSDSVPEEVATNAKKEKDAAVDSTPVKEIVPADSVPQPSVAVDDSNKQPEDVEPQPEATKVESRKRRSASPGEFGKLFDAASIRSAFDKIVPKNPPKESEEPKPEEPKPEDPKPEDPKTENRKRRAASPIDTKVAGGPRIESRYLIEAASVEASSGKFVDQPKGLLTTCPNHDGGPVIIMIKKVNKLSFDTPNTEDEDND